MSKEQSVKSESIALAVVALLAGVLIGVVGAHSFNITDEAVTKVVRQESATDTPAAEFRASLSTRMVEHVYLTKEAAIASYQDDPSAEQRLASLEANASHVAEDLSVLDSVAKEDLQRIGDKYAVTIQAYSSAARQQNQQALRENQQQLDDLSADLAELIAKDIDTSQNEIEESLHTHTAHMRQILNAYAAGNYNEARQEERNARDHMQQFSKTLAADIVAAKSDEFE